MIPIICDGITLAHNQVQLSNDKYLKKRKKTEALAVNLNANAVVRMHTCGSTDIVYVLAASRKVKTFARIRLKSVGGGFFVLLQSVSVAWNCIVHCLSGLAFWRLGSA